MNIPKFSVKQSVLVNLITVLVYIVGSLSLMTSPKDLIPQVNFDIITITSVYPGTSAEDIEKLITAPIEDAIKGINGIKKMTSSSYEGISSIVIELKLGTDKNEAYNDIQAAVDRVRDLPADMDKPNVKKLIIEIPVIAVSLGGDIPEEKLRQYADIVENKLSRIEGVSSITKSGYREKEIWVELNPDKLIKYDIGISQIINAIRSKSVNIPSGQVNKQGITYILKTTGQISSAADVKKIIVRSNDEGNFITVSDTGIVHQTFEKEYTIHKSNGYKDISLLVLKKDTGDTVKVASRVKKLVKELENENLDPKLKFTILNDTSLRIDNRFKVLESNSLIGFIMVFIVLLIFLNSRVAIMTALGIPFSMLATFAVMQFTGISINMISLFGFILVLGMLVDDAIVIAENSYSMIENGVDPKTAAVKGANAVFWPIISSILTTIAAFSPLLLMSGVMGQFMANIPLVVIIALSSSLFEAFFVLPSHIAEFVKPINKGANGKKKINNKKGFFNRIRDSRIIRFVIFHLFSAEKSGGEALWYKKLVSNYKKILDFSLQNRYKFLGISGIFFIASIIFAIKVMDFQLFQSSGVNNFTISVETPRNANLDFTYSVITEIEKRIAKLPSSELISYESITGIASGGSRLSKSEQYENQGEVKVYLTEETERKRKTAEIIKFLKKDLNKIKGIQKLTFRKNRHGPPIGNPVEIEIQGSNYHNLIIAKEKIKKVLGTIDGVIDISDDFLVGKDEIDVSIDRRKAAIAGISTQQVGSILRTAFQGTEVSTFRKDNDLITIIVKFDEKHSKTFENLKKIYIPNPRNRMVPLSSIAIFSIKKTIRKITRIDTYRTITVSAEVDKKIISSKRANRIAEKRLAKIFKNDKTINLKYGGEEESTKESMQDLKKAFIIALFFIYMILATIFKSFIQPFIVMVAIPFGIIGVIWSLFFHGMPISFMALMAIVALSGVVVNDSIVLVDLINILREKGGKLHQNILIAGAKRLRPVLLTTITTVAGLFSMAYGIGGSDPMLKPLAVAFLWGLLFSTLLTLLLVPTLYLVIFDDIRKKFLK